MDVACLPGNPESQHVYVCIYVGKLQTGPAPDPDPGPGSSSEHGGQARREGSRGGGGSRIEPEDTRERLVILPVRGSGPYLNESYVLSYIHA